MVTSGLLEMPERNRGGMVIVSDFRPEGKRGLLRVSATASWREGARGC